MFKPLSSISPGTWFEWPPLQLALLVSGSQQIVSSLAELSSQLSDAWLFECQSSLRVLSVVILLQFPELFFLHFADTVVQQPAVVVSNDLSQGAAAGAGSNVAN